MQPEDRTREMAKTAEAEKAAETAERWQQYSAGGKG